MECTQVLTPEAAMSAIALTGFAAIGIVKVGHWVLDILYMIYKSASK